MTITACEAPRHLGLRSESEWGVWHLEAHLSETAGVTEMRFVHHLDDRVNVGDVGPGWEYYLDNLAASREGAPPVDFNDYYRRRRRIISSWKRSSPRREGPHRQRTAATLSTNSRGRGYPRGETR
jgi:hypothetical protein